MLNLVPFVSVENMMKLVLHIGVEQVLCDLAAEIEADFLRWPLFDKTPRVASHSDVWLERERFSVRIDNGKAERGIFPFHEVRAALQRHQRSILQCRVRTVRCCSGGVGGVVGIGGLRVGFDRLLKIYFRRERLRKSALVHNVAIDAVAARRKGG